ncbi:hypothetical protein Y032_0016g3110 [Ancylostoma ceylanicum]|nr:hypothetical protein Y032_0016g3110 [Ancylostoma ceylanicum]
MRDVRHRRRWLRISLSGVFHLYSLGNADHNDMNDSSPEHRELRFHAPLIRNELRPLVTPSCLTRTAHTALGTNRLCVMGLTPLKWPEYANQSRLARPFSPHDDTHRMLLILYGSTCCSP